MKNETERKYWSESGSLITKEQWEKEQAARFPAFARDLAARAQAESNARAARGKEQILEVAHFNAPGGILRSHGILELTELPAARELEAEGLISIAIDVSGPQPIHKFALSQSELSKAAKAAYQASMAAWARDPRQDTYGESSSYTCRACGTDLSRHGHHPDCENL